MQDDHPGATRPRGAARLLASTRPGQYGAAGRSKGRAWGRALAMVVLAAALPSRTAAAQGSSSFTDQERRRLRAGHLIVRPATQRRGGLRLIGGSAFQVIDAPPDVVWRATLDVSHWTRFVPEVVEARVVRTRGDHMTVYVRHEHAPISASYDLDIERSADARMARFHLDKSRPHSIREGWGFFSVTPFGDAQSMVTFGVMVDVGSGLMTGLLRPTLPEWMLRLPEQLKHYVERRARARGAPR